MMRIEINQDTTSTTRHIRAEVLEAPLVEEEYTVGYYSSKGKRTQIRRYRLVSVAAVQKDDEKWKLSVGLQRIKRDGSESMQPRVVVTAYSAYGLHRNDLVLEARAQMMSELGLSREDIQHWSSEDV